MEFALVQNESSPLRDRVGIHLKEVCERHGHTLAPATNGVRFVLNLTSSDHPQAFRRRSKSVYVVSIVEESQWRPDFRPRCYTTLIRSLSNLLISIVPPGDIVSEPEIYFTTPEAGFYHMPFDSEAVYERLLPIVSAHFATDNTLEEDLPEPYRAGSPVVEELKRYAGELDRLGVLPAPFPLHEVLSAADLAHIYKIYGITGASYGNLSAREIIPAFGNTTFWMTARGVNKSALTTVGRDVLLVKGFDQESGTAFISNGPGADPKARVSVDAIEHYMIYHAFPEVGAIVHVHAWMDGVLCTRQNYPCGTRELALEVVDLLRQAGDPSRAVVGLKNHGLTITGHSLADIFDRIRDKLKTQVPMFA